MKKKAMFYWVGSKAETINCYSHGFYLLASCLSKVVFSPVTTPPKPTGVEELDIKTVYFDNPDNPIVCAVGSKGRKR